MMFRTKKPLFDVVDGEYVIPIRLSEALAHNLMAGWAPLGFGWAHLRSRTDDSYDLFIRQGTISEDMNLVNLELVQKALFAAVELAQSVIDNETEDEDVIKNAKELLTQVAQATA